jgi:uncharacterized caspase-like protein
MSSRVMILVGLLAAALLTATDANAERRVALVVGNSEYAEATTLRNPRNDASDLAATLKNLGFEVLLGLDLDQQRFAALIDQFSRRLDEADVGLFFYAGHGLQLDERNYLVSTNAKLDSAFLISAETIELDAIIRLMESKAPVNLVFLDACRNNPLAENLKRDLASLKRGAALGRGLARIEPTGRDTLVAFSAAPGQEAADGDGSDHNSPFAAALLRYIPQPGLEVSVMLKQVAADVRRDTRNEQRPQQVSDMSRTFYFVKAETKPAVDVAKVDAAPPRNLTAATPSGNSDAGNRELDIAYWNSAQSQGDCDAVHAYLQRFPQGNFVDLAKLSERRLCAPARLLPTPEAAAAARTPDASPPVDVVQQPQSVAQLPAEAPPQPAKPDVGVEAPATIVVKPAPSSVSTKEAALSTPDSSTTAPGPTVTAVAPESAAAQPDPVRTIQLELARVGCGDIKADGKWQSATRAAVRRFNAEAQTAFDVHQPSPALLAALHEHGQRVCPLECERGFQVHGETCEAIDTASSGGHRRRYTVQTQTKQWPAFGWPGLDNRKRPNNWLCPSGRC